MSERTETRRGFDSLSVEEQIALLQDLWDRIARDPEEVPVPNWHLEVLHARQEKGEEDQTSRWQEVRERILRRHDLAE